MYLDALGQPMIILGTRDAAIDLLEKCFLIYSDRSPQRMAKLSGFGWVTPILSYGPWWKQHRRTFHQFFNPSAASRYRLMQQRDARRFALRLVEDPGSLTHHIRRLFGLTIIRIAYGIEVDDGNEEYLTIAARALAVFSKVTVPGRYLVETLPFPGARFKREAAQYMPIAKAILDRPWDATVAAAKAGTAPPSIASTLLERISQLPAAETSEEETVARDVAATLSTVQTFFLAMAANPAGRARRGHRRAAPALELLRWRSVLPLGIPHRAIEEDEYRGFLIPKGSVVISNLWRRDPKVYPDPEAFKPERICPGRYFAESSLFIVVSTVLHSLSIAAAQDEQGRSVPLSGKMTEGLLSYPEPFECVVKPPSSTAESLIRESCGQMQM
ncbi:cytochrome P450 [Daedaleopsis nitida]|nr:cytochrome P450 [Daedaleopsis nitida]